MHTQNFGLKSCRFFGCFFFSLKAWSLSFAGFLSNMHFGDQPNVEASHRQPVPFVLSAALELSNFPVPGWEFKHISQQP